jgi:RNA polymerase sigma-70 factor (ECF subfamily)
LPEDGLPLQAPEPPEVEQGVRDILDRVKDLPEELRTPLVLFHIDGMKYADIARAMECPVGTVRSRLFEARERLKKLVMKADPR